MKIEFDIETREDLETLLEFADRLLLNKEKKQSDFQASMNRLRQGKDLGG